MSRADCRIRHPLANARGSDLPHFRRSAFGFLLRRVRGLGRGLLLAQLLVAAALALPGREHGGRVCRALIDGAVGRDDFPAANGACATAYRLPLNVNRRNEFFSHTVFRSKDYRTSSSSPSSFSFLYATAKIEQKIETGGMRRTTM